MLSSVDIAWHWADLPPRHPLPGQRVQHNRRRSPWWGESLIFVLGLLLLCFFFFLWFGIFIYRDSIPAWRLGWPCWAVVALTSESASQAPWEAWSRCRRHFELDAGQGEDESRHSPDPTAAHRRRPEGHCHGYASDDEFAIVHMTWILLC
jgi:hypothetical protein